MTIRNCWCPDCEEMCTDHITICTICGATLIAVPQSITIPRQQQQQQRTNNDPRIRPVDMLGFGNFVLPSSSAAAIAEQGTATTTNEQQQHQQAGSSGTTTGTGADTHNNNNNNNNRSGTGTVRLLRDDIIQTRQELHTLIELIRQQIDGVTADQQELIRALQNSQNNNVVWETIPPGLLDPNRASQQQPKNPTNQQYLQSIPRIVLQKDNHIFHTASLTVICNNNQNNPKNEKNDDDQQESESNNNNTTPANSPTITNNNTSILSNIQVIPAEFGNEHIERIYTSHNTNTTTNITTMIQTTPMTTIDIQNAYLIIADPITGIGNKLNQSCIDQINQIRQLHHNNNFNNNNDEYTDSLSSSSCSIVLFFTRGDNVTFVQKAILAQQLNNDYNNSNSNNNNGKVQIVGCIIGNNIDQPWPYKMQDSKKEATTYKLHIPVVMTSLYDTQKILQLATKVKSNNNKATTTEMIDSIKMNSSNSSSATTTNFLTCNLHIQQRSGAEEGCIICTEEFLIGQTILQLPCHHTFHEHCVIQWLTLHNTCPYCRYELPSTSSDGNNNNSNNNNNNNNTMATRTTQQRNNNNNNNNNNSGSFYG